MGKKCRHLLVVWLDWREKKEGIDVTGRRRDAQQKHSALFDFGMYLFLFLAAMDSRLLHHLFLQWGGSGSYFLG